MLYIYCLFLPETTVAFTAVVSGSGSSIDKQRHPSEPINASSKWEGYKKAVGHKSARAQASKQQVLLVS